MKLKDITVEYRTCPIGLDVNPRFSWKLQSEKQNVMQSAYRIQVWQTKPQSGRQVWDSGKTESEESLFISYDGERLEPFTGYQAVITVWDNQGEEAEAPVFFETGLLSQDNWQAEWISHEAFREQECCPVFTRQISVSRKVAAARAYVTSLGVYELSVNGSKAGDSYLAPGWTSYHNRLQYQTYDITEQLREGESNEIAVTVGNGWYKGYLNGNGERCLYGDQTAVLAMVRICYEDGTVQTVGTSPEWSVTSGVIRSSELYNGEVQDFTVTDADVYPAQVFDASEKVKSIVSQECEPVRITERIKAVEKKKTPGGGIILDFGQNFAGFVEVRLPKTKGQCLKISHAEALDAEGNFYTENLRTAKAQDIYIYDEKQVGSIVRPHFTYHGFRYIRIEGAAFEEIVPEDFTGCVLHTDMAPTGRFVTNNGQVNRLFKNILWGQRSNFVDIPTDCPQRDERLGWTGDAQIFCRTGMSNFQTALFYKKWLRDVAAESNAAFGVPQMVPNVVGDGVGTSIWGDCATIVPWTLYRMYKDAGVLEEQYENMKLWVDYITNACGDSVLWMNGFQRGDWLSLDGDESLHPMSGGTDKGLVANVYYAYSVRILRDTAKALKKRKDESRYGELYEEIVTEINDEYVTKTGRLVTETQSACALLLYFDLISSEHRSRVIRTFEDTIKKHHGHLTTGFVGTAYLCHALTESGLHHLAGDILLSEEYPGWLYSLKMGATTIWERWDSVRPDGSFDTSGMNSLNHYSYGSIGDWLYRKIAGICPLEAGYKKILIKPTLTAGLWEVSSSVETMYGETAVSYRCRDGMLTVDVTVPPNTTAVLELPEQEEEIHVGSGHWHYEYETETDLEPAKYTMNTTVGEVLELPGGAAVMEKYVPGAGTGPMAAYMKGKTFNELAAMSGGQEKLFSAILKEINALCKSK